MSQPTSPAQSRQAADAAEIVAKRIVMLAQRLQSPTRAAGREQETWAEIARLAKQVQDAATELAK